MTTAPIPTYPKGKEHHHKHLKHSRKELPPRGKRMGRSIWRRRCSTPIQDRRQWENNTKRFAAFQGFAPTRQSGRSRKTSPIQSPIPAFHKGKEHHVTTSNTAKWNSRPLGMAWGGASASSSNSVGVAIPQPRVAGEARYPGYPPPLIWQLYRSCD